jgi:hypothetical protein
MPGNNEKTATITAAEQRDNSSKTASRSGEQRVAPQAGLEMEIAANPVMRSIWERFFEKQEQKENNLCKGGCRDSANPQHQILSQVTRGELDADG